LSKRREEADKSKDVNVLEGEVNRNGHRSRSVSKHSEGESRNGGRHRGGRDHELRSDDDEESDNEHEKLKSNNGNGNDDRYDPTKTDDEDNASISPKSQHNLDDLNGDNIVSTGYQSNNEVD